MAYLSPKFPNDIFLSYARVDNESPRPNEGWVDFFRKFLEIELSKQIGDLGVVKIWMDTRRLDSNQYFDDAIKNEIQRSGVFLALTSPGYLHPDGYCREELAEFYRKARQAPESLRVGTRSRVVNALLYDIQYDGWPPEYEGIGGSKLFDTAQAEFGDPSRIGSELLDTQVKQLAREIFRLLQEYKQTFTEPVEEPPPPDAPKVFLADTVESLSEIRSCVVSGLKRAGIQTLRRIPPPYAADDHDRVAAEQISSADLSVHLFDATPGEKFMEGDSGKTFLQRQAEVGLENAKSQFLWVPPKALVDIPSIKEPNYRDFLLGLENRERDKRRYTFQRDPANGVTDEILNRIKELQRPAQPSIASAALLETHRKDQLHALELYPLLLERALQPYINPDNDDPGENFDTFQRLVGQISVLIIIFGVVASDWVRERLVSSLQLAGTLEPRRLKLCGIYAPPGEGAAERQMTLGTFPGSIPIFFFNDRETLAQLLDDFVLGGGK